MLSGGEEDPRGGLAEGYGGFSSRPVSPHHLSRRKALLFMLPLPLNASPRDIVSGVQCH